MKPCSRAIEILDTADILSLKSTLFEVLVPLNVRGCYDCCKLRFRFLFGWKGDDMYTSYIEICFLLDWRLSKDLNIAYAKSSNLIHRYDLLPCFRSVRWTDYSWCGQFCHQSSLR